MQSQEKSRRVFVGLSGGVDSSVSAALLKKAGYDVTGVFIKVWTPDFIPCTWKEDRLDAMRVCAKLQIPFVTLDLEKEYKKEVVDYMIALYRAGKTPNPDVMCNAHIKFGGFYKWAMAQGADYVATGHYARLREIKYQKSKIKNYELLSGTDKDKDQSYFLWQIKQEQLSRILFPVSGMLKPEVRKLAKKFGLITADKKDSQGLCFLGKIDMKEFLKNYIKPKAGNVLDERGEIVGTHDGAIFFTLGERHGFKITQHGTRNIEQKPYYIISKNVKKNTITVSHDPKTSVGGDSRTIFEIEKVNWLSRAPAAGATLSARIRYRQPLQLAQIHEDTVNTRISADGHQRKSALSSAKISVRFTQAQSGGAAGQSIVIYAGEQCLGGGIIV